MNSKLTREQLHERARENVKALKMASRQTAFESAREEILADLQLAEMALAAMESEPVAWTWLYREQWHVTNDERRAEFVAKDGDVAVLPLYRHAQSAQLSEPVLPLQDKDLQGVIDALEHPAGINAAGKQVVRHALVELQERRKVERETEPYGFTDGDRRGMIYKPEHSDRLSEPVPVYRHAQPAPVVPVGLEHLRAIVADPRLLPRRKEWIGGQQYSYVLLEEVEAIVDEACRAAPQSPGSEPVTVPGKWIPVSEQMPVEFEAVIAFDGDQVYGEAMYSSGDGFTIDGYDPCDRVQLQSVTHWMPLPAAPEEVKGE